LPTHCAAPQSAQLGKIFLPELVRAARAGGGRKFPQAKFPHSREFFAIQQGMPAGQTPSGPEASLSSIEDSIVRGYLQEQSMNPEHTVDQQANDYAVGYGKPPLETRFHKGRSGNPGGRRRGTKSLAALLGEALSRRSGFPNADGSWMTQAEAIFAALVAQAVGTDLKAKRLLFDLLVKLQRANVGWPQDRLPEIRLDDSADPSTPPPRTP
jgi:Family of unknown function (DUF5681)